MTKPGLKISAQAKVIGLSGTLAALAGAALWAAIRSAGAVHAPISIPWWGFALAFLATEALVFHVEIRQEAHSFSLSELPLVIGFFFASPWSVIAGRLLAHLIYRTIVRRQTPLKLVFNLSSFAAETGVALFVFHALSDGNPPTAPHSWIAILAAVMVADALSVFSVTTAIQWSGAEAELTRVMTTAGVTAVANASLSVLAAIVLWDSPWAMILFSMMAIIVALAYRGYAGLRQRYSSLQLLYDFTKMVGASVTAEAVMDEVLGEARKLLRAERAEVLLLDEETGVCGHRIRSQEGTSADTDGATSDLPEPIPGLEQSWVWDEVVQRRRPVVIGRAPRARAQADFLDTLGARDCIVAPLLAEGRVVGAILVADRMGSVGSFDHEDLALFATLANHASVAFENGRLVDQLRREADERRYEALHDSLTGLANRTLFLQRVGETGGAARARGDQRLAAVMLMDLDRFKEVNDTLGHHNGDLLLREVANRIVAAVRQEDTVARLGGDEFAILLPRLASVDQALSSAQRIVEALQKSFSLNELSVDVGASIGIAISPTDGVEAATLLQRADVAMYEAKGAPQPVMLYSPERDNYSPKRLTMAAELRQALADGDVVVYHQPKARLSDGVIIGTEALVRWRHPTRGLIGPDEFIPVAEQTGLIEPLTLYVLKSALEQCRQWNDAGHDIGVAVNLSVRSLLDPDLSSRVEALLAETGVSGSRLTLEITESGVMADPNRAIALLERLADTGVKLSVDDFGTGYSSLSYLRRLPVHEVKVDRSFVFRMATDPSDATIVQSIIELGRNLGLRTVAEGVEDQISWEMLRGMGCDVAQGYLLSKPIPAQSLTRWLDDVHRVSLIPAGTAPEMTDPDALAPEIAERPHLPVPDMPPAVVTVEAVVAVEAACDIVPIGTRRLVPIHGPNRPAAGRGGHRC
ncbi:MAG: putative bifunctional diguanylate cyclase/phosphodiesterase [Acidimicrobiales bacterium]